MGTENTKDDEIKFEVEGEQKQETQQTQENNTEENVEIVDDTSEKDRGREPMKDPPREVTDDELNQYTENVRKRIQHFSRGYHDERRAKEAAERERNEAIRIAEAIAEENKKLKGNLSLGQNAFVDQAKKTAELEYSQAKAKYKAAYDAGDGDALLAAQDEMLTAKIKLDKVANYRPATGQTQKDNVQSETTANRPAPPQQTQQLDSKAQAWTEANPWFQKDKRMTRAALAIHQGLIEDEGITAGSDEYYRRLNADLKEQFPDKFKTTTAAEETPTREKPRVVAPVSRSTAPKTIVLSKSQVAVANRLGVPLAEYAKHVALMERGKE